MSGIASTPSKKTADRIGRMIREYRTPVFAMVLFCIFGIALTGSPCMLRTITGMPCPGCGLTRATLALFRLDAAEAFRDNPMVFLVWPSALLLVPLIVLKKISIKKCTPFFILFGVCMILAYIVRMILYFPNMEPMTYDYDSMLGRVILLVRQWV